MLAQGLLLLLLLCYSTICSDWHNRLKMILSEGIELRDLYRVAAEQNVQIRRLNYRRDSLEDIFLKAMDSDLAGAAPTARQGAANGRL